MAHPSQVSTTSPRMSATDMEPLLGSGAERSDADAADAAEAAEQPSLASTAQTGAEEKARLKTEAEARAAAAPAEKAAAEKAAAEKQAVASKAQSERELSTPQAQALEPEPPPEQMGERPVTTETSGDSRFKHGLVDFAATGTRAKYLIVPANCEDDLAVLRAACRAWGLSLPNLVVSVQGGQTCPENWWYWLSEENSVWTSGKADFNDSVKQLYVGVAKACAESKAWVYSWNDCIRPLRRRGACCSSVSAKLL